MPKTCLPTPTISGRCFVTCFIFSIQFGITIPTDYLIYFRPVEFSGPLPPHLGQAGRQEADQTLQQFAETEAAWDASKTFLADAEPTVCRDF